jgi:uncharacterized protein with PQ loop repeat
MNSEALVIMFDVNNSDLTPEEYFILENVIGYTSNILIFCMMIPQIYKAYKFRLTDDISYKFIWISLLSTVLEIIYGVLINQIPVLLTGIICMIQMTLLGVAKKLYDNSKETKILRKFSVINNHNHNNHNNNINSNHEIVQNKEQLENPEQQIRTWEVHDEMFTYIFKGDRGVNKVDIENIDNVELCEIVKRVRVNFKT